MKISFEARRLYVAPRKSVLFFARSNDEKIRCYVQQDALIEPARGLREESGVFQRCLLAFDQHARRSPWKRKCLSWRSARAEAIHDEVRASRAAPA